jgi:hypothetical protein
MDSTLTFAVLVGDDRKFTALGYRSNAHSAAFPTRIVPRHSHIFPGSSGSPASRFFCA